MVKKGLKDMHSFNSCANTREIYRNDIFFRIWIYFSQSMDFCASVISYSVSAFFVLMAAPPSTPPLTDIVLIAGLTQHTFMDVR